MRPALLTVTALFIASSAQAQNNPDIPPVLLQHIQPRMPIERYVANILDLVRDVDTGRDGLDTADIERVGQKTSARSRAARLQQFFSLDLNNDLQVTAEEAKNATEAGTRTQDLFRYDADSDGVLTFEEMRAASDGPRNDGPQVDVHRAPQRPPLYGEMPGGNARDNVLAELLGLDPNKDGKLTLAEAEALAREIFAKVSTDGDDMISEQEYSAVMRSIREPRPTCQLPPPAPNDRIVVFSTHEGATASDVHLGDPEEETYVIDIEIDAGDAPLYVVLSSYESAIFRFNGAADRISKLVFAMPKNHEERPLGAIGLPADKIIWAACEARFNDAASKEATQAIELIRGALKKDPDVFLGQYEPIRLTLPSGTIQSRSEQPVPARDGFDPKIWEGATRFDPGGLAVIDPASVVARGKPRKYDVLPGWFGLAKLVSEGALRQTGDGARSTFRILKPFPSYPPGLYGSHSVKFVLAKGVPEPSGKLGHSCLRIEETGLTKGSTCEN